MPQSEDFTRYSKISETFLYLPNGNCLKFCVKLKKYNKEKDNTTYYHREYNYRSEDGTIAHSINIIVLWAGWQLGNSNDLKKCVSINAGSVFIVSYHLQKIIDNWYFGENSIYSINKSGNLYIKGKYKPVQIPFDDYNYIEFSPIIITYEDGMATQGCRIAINDKNNYIDLNMNDFLNLYSCLKTDTTILVNTLLLYAKCPPYNINSNDISNFNEDNKSYGNFFTNKQDKQ